MRSFNDALVRSIELSRAAIPKFSGDPTQFDVFTSAFDARISAKSDTDADRLYFLDQYLEGEAKELIGGCLHYQDATQGYKEARRLLAEEYGTPYRISAAYYEKLMEWPTIKKDDAASLKKLSLLIS
jgi:hypothetical protein